MSAARKLMRVKQAETRKQNKVFGKKTAELEKMLTSGKITQDQYFKLISGLVVEFPMSEMGKQARQQQGKPPVSSEEGLG